MDYFAYVPGGTGVVEGVSVCDQAWVDSQPNPTWYVNVTSEVPRPGPGWTYNGAVFTAPAPVPRPNRMVLSGPEWVQTFTDAEWQWLKTERNSGTAGGDKMDKQMDAIRWTNSVDVSHTNMDQFYDHLVVSGIPGGQTRVDELREGIPQ